MQRCASAVTLRREFAEAQASERCHKLTEKADDWLVLHAEWRRCARRAGDDANCSWSHGWWWNEAHDWPCRRE